MDDRKTGDVQNDGSQTTEELIPQAAGDATNSYSLLEPRMKKIYGMFYKELYYTPELSLDEAMAVPEERHVDLVALDDSLNSLASLDIQQGRIVELRFFGGLSIEETAEVLGVSPATVKRDWAMAKAWLYRDMTSGSRPAGL